MLALDIQSTLEVRRREIEAAKARCVQHTADNRRLHRRRAAATDTLLHLVKHAREGPPATPAGAPNTPSPAPPAAPQCPSTATSLPQHAPCGSATAPSAPISTACMLPLQPADVLSAATDGNPADLVSAAALVTPADIRAAEGVVQGIAVRLAALRTRAAHRAGVAAPHVRWLLQTPYITPGDAPLSFSTARASASCQASRHAFSLAVQLETCFLMASEGPIADLRVGALCAVVCPGPCTTCSQRSFCYDDARQASAMQNAAAQAGVSAGYANLAVARHRSHVTSAHDHTDALNPRGMPWSEARRFAMVSKRLEAHRT